VQTQSQVGTAWVRRYNGPINENDIPTAIAVDRYGNIFVTGKSIGPQGNADYVTIKYYPNGETAWVRRYNGTGNEEDVPTSLTVDTAGNCIVTGWSYVTPNDIDYLTIKYNPQGDTIWTRRSNLNGNEKACAVITDRACNVYVTGTAPGSYSDIYTIKYSPSGEELWAARWDYHDAQARAITCDHSGNIYICGWLGIMGDDQYVTLKYLSTSGTLAWFRTYNFGGGGYPSEVPNAITCDIDGNIIVTGRIWGGSSNSDWATIKYNSNGDIIWTRRYNGSGNSADTAYSIITDVAKNIYITGTSVGIEGTLDWVTIKYSSTGDTCWVRRYNSPSNSRDGAYAIALDNEANPVVVGYCYSSSTYEDYKTIKYRSSDGSIIWEATYNGFANLPDFGLSVAVDEAGTVYVTGKSVGAGTFYDYVTIKYIQGGGSPQSQIWTSPRYFNITLQENQTKDTILRIFNNGDADLEWNLTENPQVHWLSENPTSGTVSPRPNNRMDVTLSFNTAGLNPGVYHTNLLITNNDPDLPEKIVPVELRVKPSVDIIEYSTTKLLPEVFALENNIPNPFISRTVIRYALPKDSRVNLLVYNSQGILVRKLKTGIAKPGFYQVVWDGKDDKGRKVPNGVYFYRLKADEFTAMRKVVKVE
jgi:hypothetical protein